MIAAAQAPVKIYTVEEYFELEKTSKVKHESLLLADIYEDVVFKVEPKTES